MVVPSLRPRPSPPPLTFLNYLLRNWPWNRINIYLMKKEELFSMSWVTDGGILLNKVVRDVNYLLIQFVI